MLLARGADPDAEDEVRVWGILGSRARSGGTFTHSSSPNSLRNYPLVQKVGLLLTPPSFVQEGLSPIHLAAERGHGATFAVLRTASSKS